MTDRYAAYANESRPCFHCGTPTNRIEINFQGHLCLGCEPAAWRAYWKAVRE